jgi:hypothetical protein
MKLKCTDTNEERNMQSNEIIEIEKERLNIDKDRLTVEKDRLTVEKERLEIERKKLTWCIVHYVYLTYLLNYKDVVY